MATWWRVNPYACKIEPVEVARETEHFIFIYKEYCKANQQIAKGTEYWRTFREARQHLLDRASQNADSAKRDLERARRLLAAEAFMMEELEEPK